MAKKNAETKASKAADKKQSAGKGHAAPGKTEAGTSEARAPFVGGVKQIKPIETEGDPTLMARPELTEHGLTRKEAAPNRVQQTPEEMAQAAGAAGATNYNPGSGAQSAAEKAARGEGIDRETLQRPRPPAADRERVPAESEQSASGLKDQEK